MGASRALVLDFIRDFIDEHGYSPSRREAAKALGMGVGTVQYHIDRLVEMGLLWHVPGTMRTIRVLPRGEHDEHHVVR